MRAAIVSHDFGGLNATETEEGAWGVKFCPAIPLKRDTDSPIARSTRNRVRQARNNDEMFAIWNSDHLQSSGASERSLPLRLAGALTEMEACKFASYYRAND